MFARGQVFQYMVISEAPTQDWEHVKYTVRVISSWADILNWHLTKAKKKSHRLRSEYTLFDLTQIVSSQLEFRHVW